MKEGKISSATVNRELACLKICFQRLLIGERLSAILSSEYVFFNHKTKTRVKNVIKSFMTACKRAGIKGVNIHALRHTAATKMINEAGVGVVTAGKILGHSSIKMTLRYCHPSEETMQRAVDKLGEIFEKSRHKVVIPKDSDEVEKPASFFPYFV